MLNGSRGEVGGRGGKQTLKTHLLFLSYRKDRGMDLWRVTCVSLSWHFPKVVRAEAPYLIGWGGGQHVPAQSSLGPGAARAADRPGRREVRLHDVGLDGLHQLALVSKDVLHQAPGGFIDVYVFLQGKKQNKAAFFTLCSGWCQREQRPLRDRGAAFWATRLNIPSHRLPMCPLSSPFTYMYSFKVLCSLGLHRGEHVYFGLSGRRNSVS